MDKAELVSLKMIGRKTSGVPGQILITNIKPIYGGILKRSHIIDQSSGYYESAVISFAGGEYLMIRTTPGNAVVDILKLIKPVAGEISLVGFAGSLNDRFPIGSLVCPNMATEMSDLSARRAIVGGNEDGGTICQTDGLLQKTEFYEQLIENKIDFVDMESFYLASACKDYGIRARTLSIVSDMPLASPFYVDNDLSENLEGVLDELANKL